MMARVFFKATEDALNNITELFNLVHPLRTSMHYTRNAVAQMATENPNADDDYFKAIIDPGNNVHGTGFREAFIVSRKPPARLVVPKSFSFAQNNYPSEARNHY